MPVHLRSISGKVDYEVEQVIRDLVIAANRQEADTTVITEEFRPQITQLATTVRSLGDLARVSKTQGDQITNIIANGVQVSGLPVDNQVAVWASAIAIEGDAALTWDGAVLAATVLESTVAPGTAPLIVASPTLVANLNADLLDSREEGAFALLLGRVGGQTLIGGTGVTDDLVLQTTSGVGTVGSVMNLRVGNNGATLAAQIAHTGEMHVADGATVAIGAARFFVTGNVAGENVFACRTLAASADLFRGNNVANAGIFNFRCTNNDARMDLFTQHTARIRLVFAHTEVTGMSGATVTAASLIPAASFIVGVTVRVTTAITGAATFDIGDGSDVDRWGAGIAIAAGTVTSIANFTADGFGQFAAATSVVLTANGGNFTAGAVRIVVHILNINGPSS